ncbi:MAG: CocE/NonD family hydrolase [Gemmatimonadetes bacterium]|nr:CocE/NonD family hydrolase [Gemmatimonadota bacterium]
MKANVAPLLVVLSFGWPGYVDAQGEPPYEAAILYEKDLMIPMRDGVRIATDIYRPARNGVPVGERLPILLHRTAYDKSAVGRRPEVELFVRHGYVVVIQDARGRYKSEGTFSKYFKYDALDGYDSIEWLTKLPYVEPKVGMWGTSYGAHAQADVAKMNPPALKTLVINQGGLYDGWDHGIGYHGAYEVGRQITWAASQLVGEPAFRRLGSNGEPPLNIEELLELGKEWQSALPLRKGLNPFSGVPAIEDYLLKMAEIGDEDYWKGLGVNWVHYYDQTADIPMLHAGGWYDIFTGGTIRNYVELSRRKKSPIRLLMGPWIHGSTTVTRTYAGDVDFGVESAIPDFETYFHLRWFDHFLKGEKTGVEREAPVRLFVMGTGDGRKDRNGRLQHGGYWRSEEQWPLPNTRFASYYFDGDGRLSPKPPDAVIPSTIYTFDPRDPVPTIGGGVSSRLVDGAFDQREREGLYGARPPYLPLKARPDVVVFQTETLEEDVEVVGPIVVKLYASSTAVDTDFTAKLVDVQPPSPDYPFGYDLNLTDGIVRARFRNGRGTEELMTPGQVYEFTIEPFPTANVFRKGHRIRIDISSSNFPRFDVNPNTGEPLGRHRRVIPADNTIHHSSAYPSHVVLPIVPTKWKQ